MVIVNGSIVLLLFLIIVIRSVRIIMYHHLILQFILDIVTEFVMKIISYQLEETARYHYISNFDRIKEAFLRIVYISFLGLNPGVSFVRPWYVDVTKDI